MKHNFGAGPCILPQDVFKEAAAAVLDFNGLSILEVSHRHKDFVAVMDEAIELVKKALDVPAGYSVAFLQGGASLGFTIAALNMQRAHKSAGYINTGTWASGAIKEAKKVEEDDVEEGNKFTGNLAKARADGKTEADLDGDGDMEKVKESVQDLKRLWSQFKG